MAIISMTGFGRGEISENGVKVVVELSTVNRKQFDCNISMPRELGCLEAKLHALIHAEVSRGYVKGNVALKVVQGGEDMRLLNMELLKAQIAELREAARLLNVVDDLGVSALLQLPDAMNTTSLFEHPEEVWGLIEQATKQALKQLGQMRAREGAALEADLRRRFLELKVLSETIAPLAATVPKQYQATLEKRLADLVGEGAKGVVDPALLAREVAIFADRCDVSEELTRLASHFVQVVKVLEDGQASGRTLDFLCQELFREINTTGSKANDAEITRLVIAFKAGLEAAREQVQNVE
ncbi:MAG: YicC/YloC family endoribonuclease [bacterium]